MVVFDVPGVPVGKGRPRFSGRGVYTPEKTQAYEELVRLKYWAAARGEKRIEGPVSLTVTAYFAPPASASKAARDAMIQGRERPCRKPDFDNILKIIADALNRVAWKDDAQVTRCVIEKRYAERARIVVSVREDDSGCA